MQNKEAIYQQQVLAAVGTGVVMTLSNPFDLIRNRLQTMGQLLRQRLIKDQYHGVRDCFSKVSKGEGFVAFWKGNGANLLRFYPNQTFNFVSKQSIQRWVRNSELVDKKNMYAVNFVSGILGSWIVFFFIYPFDFARTQLSNDIKGNGTIRSFLRNTYKEEGLKGVYRGGLVNFILSPLFRGLYYGVFDTVKQISPTLEAKLIGGYLGSFIAILACYPIDTIRRRLVMTACQNYKYDGFFDCWSYVYKSEGIKGFFRGGSIIFFQSFSCACILFLYDKIANDFRNLHALHD